MVIPEYAKAHAASKHRWIAAANELPPSGASNPSRSIDAGRLLFLCYHSFTLERHFRNLIIIKMENRRTMSCGALDILPREILVEVLAAAPDIRSLLLLGSTCRSLHQLITDPSLSLPQRVLSNRIDSKVIEMAFLASDVRSRYGWLLSWLPRFSCLTPDDVQKGINTKPQHWDLDVVLAMDRLHTVVEALTDRYISDVLAEQYPASANEVHRVQSAFYRAQILCVLKEHQDLRGRWKSLLPQNFFLRFAPWENEQLACIWDWMGQCSENGRCDMEYELVTLTKSQSCPSDLKPRSCVGQFHGLF